MPEAPPSRSLPKSGTLFGLRCFGGGDGGVRQARPFLYGQMRDIVVVEVMDDVIVMSLVALTGAVSHVSMGAQLFPLPMAVVVVSCLIGAVLSARFANRCEIRKPNRVVGVVLAILGVVTILIKLL